jgi:SAM-dependent methyltransferase
MYHAVRLSIGDKLFFAPVDPSCVLDVGTGTGIWAVDLADAYPAAEVIGTDLSPIQPTYVPPNLRFEIEDADEEWTFRQKFDLVHTRVMNDTSLKDWAHFYREAFKALSKFSWSRTSRIGFRGPHLPDQN